MSDDVVPLTHAVAHASKCPFRLPDALAPALKQPPPTMGLFSGITKAFKSAVGGLSKLADVVAPICSFIPGLNPVVTAIAAGIKAVDGLTDKPPNFGKMFEGVMGMLPGGALGKALGPFAKLGGGTAGQFAEALIGSAVGDNPISFLIPCHRVIRKSGAISDYHWGRPRKMALIGWEAARAERRSAAMRPEPQFRAVGSD